MQHKFIQSIKDDLDANDGRLSYTFITSLVSSGTTQYLHPTPKMRLCIITLRSGHEVLGKSQVLDAVNDVESIGNKIAYDNAIDELWSTIGSIAKIL